ncbi:arylacetamide deacetylase-like 4 isoform X2 [Eleutherodactylus coqui]|uniref:arylacetamide deacetylase-like 4 isoform X2 n=1 Tax=Eleutherodactylus coqui TaxID=57060 RepID=UPI003462F639
MNIERSQEVLGLGEHTASCKNAWSISGSIGCNRRFSCGLFADIFGGNLACILKSRDPTGDCESEITLENTYVCHWHLHPDLYDSLCGYLTKNSGAVVVSVGYRLAPEHRCPAAFDDCLKATVHFLKTAQEHGVDPSSVIICGDSAGGNLTAGVCQCLVGIADIPKPLAQVMIYPALQIADFNVPSYEQNKMVPLLLRERAVYCAIMYIGADLSLSKEMIKGSHVTPEVREKLNKWLSSEEFQVKGYKPHIMAPFNKGVYEKVKKSLELPCSPLFSDDAVIRQLPKAYILTCEFDVLRDDGILYKKRLEDNGVPVTWFHVKDGFHGIFTLFDQPEVVSGKLAMDNVITYIKNL